MAPGSSSTSRWADTGSKTRHIPIQKLHKHMPEYAAASQCLAAQDFVMEENLASSVLSIWRLKELENDMNGRSLPILGAQKKRGPKLEQVNKGINKGTIIP